MRFVSLGPAGGTEDLALKVEMALSSLQVSGFDVDVLSSGVVTRFRISTDGSKIAIFVDFSGSDPSCNFCRMINYSLWAKIISMIKKKMRDLGFSEVVVLDSATGLEVVLPKL